MVELGFKLSDNCRNSFITTFITMNKRKRNKLNRNQRPPVNVSSQIPSLPRKKNNLFSITWKVILGIATIAGIISAFPVIEDWISTPKEKYTKDFFVEGDLKPTKLLLQRQESKDYRLSDLPLNFNLTPSEKIEPIIKGIRLRNLHKRKFLYIMAGNVVLKCDIADFYKGVRVFSKKFEGCSDSNLILGIKDDRLYVSVEFKDFQKEETIGVIEFNHWKLYKPNLFDFDNDDTKLQVRDKQHNTVFSIRYIAAQEPQSINTVILTGYFINPSSVLVLSLDSLGKGFSEAVCYSKGATNWKTIVLQSIQKINSDTIKSRR